MKIPLFEYDVNNRYVDYQLELIDSDIVEVTLTSNRYMGPIYRVAHNVDIVFFILPCILGTNGLLPLKKVR